AGEASGDMHSANLVKELKKIDKDAVLRGWGGALMKKQGVDIVKNYKDTAFMGFVEVIKHIRTILKNINFCKEDILFYKPDALILVDYPGFNLRIAKFAYKNKIKVFYYISPQVWAWKTSRVRQIKKYVNRMFVVLPFEKEFYKKYNYEVDYVGHPLLDEILSNTDYESKSNHFKELSALPIIALIPGSRKQEIVKMLPGMLKMVEQYKDYHFVVTAVSSIPASIYNNLCDNYKVSIIYDDFYSVLSVAKAALVTSGTAALETALFGVPEIVCYKANYISYLLAKFLIKVKYISLVNLIMNKKIISELIQNDFNSINLKIEMDKLLFDDEHKQILTSDYAALKVNLGSLGASARAAALIYNNIK
ncbi:MAG: lipid-A-disaccharide synthase, partial [Bacteroidales bacterium]|nr:lipid-A-disaccharide synthase [Bacteroidales bacterium]